MVENKDSTICAILVTYSDRGDYCDEVVSRLIEMGVAEIIIVDNDSSQRSFNIIKGLSEKYSNVTIIKNDSNLGSGAAFSVALQKAITMKEEYFLLLDDDNMPEAECINKLIKAHDLLSGNLNDIVLYANRGSTRSADMKVFTKGLQKKYELNSFCNFHLKSLFIEKISQFFNNKSSNEVKFPIARVYYGPYGGMFAKKKVFEKIGLPRDDYFVYADDHEYAGRMEYSGIKQYLIESAIIDDLDISFQPGFIFLSQKVSALRTYYQIRNHTHLSQKFIQSRLIYSINKYSFLSVQFGKAWREWIVSPKKTFSRWSLLLKAISDGENTRLGQRYQGEF